MNCLEFRATRREREKKGGGHQSGTRWKMPLPWQPTRPGTAVVIFSDEVLFFFLSFFVLAKQTSSPPDGRRWRETLSRRGGGAAGGGRKEKLFLLSVRQQSTSIYFVARVYKRRRRYDNPRLPEDKQRFIPKSDSGEQIRKTQWKWNHAQGITSSTQGDFEYYT